MVSLMTAEKGVVRSAKEDEGKTDRKPQQTTPRPTTTAKPASLCLILLVYVANYYKSAAKEESSLWELDTLPVLF